MTNEEMFNDNIKLAYSIAHKYQINYPNEYEDILQCAFIGLWKAISIFDYEHKLSTIAYTIMSNEINYYLRKYRKNQTLTCAISLDEVIFKNNDRDELTFGDILKDDRDMIDDVLYNIDVENSMNRMFLTEKEKDVVRMRMDEKTQKYIAKQMGLSQCQISRIQKKVRDRLINLINR